MRYSLKPGVSFCFVSGRAIFLDLPHDRYFCLGPSAESSLRRLLGGEQPDPDDQAILTNLLRNGPLANAGEGPAVAACVPPERPTGSLLDEQPTRVSLVQLVRASLALARAPIGLKLFGLQGSIERLGPRKARPQSDDNSAARRMAVAAAFRQLRILATSHDKCLPRSIAVADRLHSERVPCQFVMAVKLQPFAAHAWVQSGDWLVNDRIDVVRDFTPILVV